MLLLLLSLVFVQGQQGQVVAKSVGCAGTARSGWQRLEKLQFSEARGEDQSTRGGAYPAAASH